MGLSTTGDEFFNYGYSSSFSLSTKKTECSVGGFLMQLSFGKKIISYEYSYEGI